MWSVSHHGVVNDAAVELGGDGREERHVANGVYPAAQHWIAWPATGSEVHVIGMEGCGMMQLACDNFALHFIDHFTLSSVFEGTLIYSISSLSSGIAYVLLGYNLISILPHILQTPRSMPPDTSPEDIGIQKSWICKRL